MPEERERESESERKRERQRKQARSIYGKNTRSNGPTFFQEKETAVE